MSITSRPMAPPSTWLGRLYSLFFLLLLLLLITAASADHFENPKLRQAYTVLEALRKAIHSDPFNFTSNWRGNYVCSYNGVFCTNSSVRAVSGIDLNHVGVGGYLPEELGGLTDLVVLHLGSNRFYGAIPRTLENLKFLSELDLSHNRFAGCLPGEVGKLKKLKVFDVSFNMLECRLPDEIGGMESVEQLNVGHNDLTGEVPESICNLPRLRNFTYSYNYFAGDPPNCGGGGGRFGGQLAKRGRPVVIPPAPRLDRGSLPKVGIPIPPPPPPPPPPLLPPFPMHLHHRRSFHSID